MVIRQQCINYFILSLIFLFSTTMPIRSIRMIIYNLSKWYMQYDEVFFRMLAPICTTLICSVILEKDLIVYNTHLLSKVLIYLNMKQLQSCKKDPPTTFLGLKCLSHILRRKVLFLLVESLFSLLRFVARHCEIHFLLTCLPFMIIYLSGYNDWVKLAGNKKQREA